MSRHVRPLLLIALFVSLVGLPLSPAAAQAGGPPPVATPPWLAGSPTLATGTHGPFVHNAASGPAWYDGLIQESTITNCVSIIQGTPYPEAGAGVYTGFLADPDNGQPSPNTVYYIHVVIYGLGNSCSGMRAYVEIALPPNTIPAISLSHPLYCFYDAVAGSDCPQSLTGSSYNPGAYAILSSDSAHANTWPIPQGHSIEIQIPVISTTTLTNSPLQANIWMLDGNSSPWLHPTEGIYVFNGSQPTIIYNTPSTTSPTTTSAHSQAVLYAFNSVGTGYFDLGTTSAYGLIHDPVSISTPATAWTVWDDWGPPALKPGTLYHWRFSYTTGSTTYYGADQTFTTLPVVLTLNSVGAQDGWVRELTETSGVGGSMNSAATTINLGDDATRKQYRGILSFSTGPGLPDNAIITSVTLNLHLNTIVGGGNPVLLFKGLMVDMIKGSFGLPALQLTDFQSPPGKPFGPFKPALVSNAYSIDLTSAKAYINKLATAGGLTQIRLRFKLDDNNNKIANYLKLFSGNAGAANRPQLVITYSLP